MVVLNRGFDIVQTNLGLPVEVILLIAVFLGSLVFFAKDFKVGIVIQFVLVSLVFMWTYHLDLNYTYAVVVMFMDLVIMAFVFYAVAKNQASGGII